MSKLATYGPRRLFLTSLGGIVLLMLVGVLCIGARHTRLGDIYDCYIIVDAESTTDGEYYDQVDYEELIDLITSARLSYISFKPRWQVNLYDDDGVRYFLYVSRSGTFLRIDNNYFRLNSRKARRLRRLLE